MNDLATSAVICAKSVPRETVYFLLSEGLVKVGYTENFPKRWREIENAVPGEVTLLFTLDGGRDLEAMIHAALDPDRDHGEWFRPTLYMRSFFAKMDEFRKPGAPRAANMLPV